MARDPRRLRALPGRAVRQAARHGTGTGFGPGDADLTRWAALVVWDDPPPRTASTAGRSDGPGRGIAAGAARLDLRPLASRGRWSGRAAVRRPGRPGTRRAGAGADPGPAAAGAGRLTFWRAVPPVAAALRDAPGLLARFGIGEAPIGWQGTVSVWRSAADLVGFAYRQPEHRAVIARTPAERWYAEELFARFAVRDVTATGRCSAG